MTKDKSTLLETRKTIKKNRPKIRRSDSWKFHRIKEDSWKRPKGRHNKMRLVRKGNCHTISFSAPNAVKGLHACGKEEIMIYNIKDLNKINSKEQVARFCATIGTKKRVEILKEAFRLKIKVLNPGIKAKKELLEGKKEKKDNTSEKKKEDKKKENNDETKKESEQKKEINKTIPKKETKTKTAPKKKQNKKTTKVKSDKK